MEKKPKNTKNNSKQKNNNQKNNSNEEEKEDISQGAITSKKDQFYLSCRVKPNAKITQIQCINKEDIEIQLAAQPRDGEANKELLDFLKQCLNVKKENLSLDSGGKNRNKVVVVSNSQYQNVDEIYNQLEKHIEE